MFYVHIYCPCADSPVDLVSLQDSSAEPTEEDLKFDSSHARAQFSCHPIPLLNFCEECHTIRCHRCVQEEIVSYFCPSCLLEVPQTNVKGDCCRCTRNCFQCPVCFSGLSVIAEESESQPYYFLQCSYCQWSSTLLNLTFDKPTGLYQQIMKRDTPATKQSHAYSLIKAHYQDYIETETSHDPHIQFSQILGLSGGIFAKRKSLKAKVPKAEMDPVEISNESELIEELENLPISDVTSISQRLAQEYSTVKISFIPYLDVCEPKDRNVVVHVDIFLFDQKPNLLQFAIVTSFLQLRNYLPTITLSPLNLASDKQTYVIRLTNPLFDSIKVSLATPPLTPTGYRVTLVCPDFEVGPNADVWDQTSTVARPTNPKKQSSEGGSIWDSGRNWTCTVLEIIPPLDKKVEQLDISMFVKLSYETEVEKDEDESGKAKLVKVNRELGFWSVIGI